MFNNSYNDGGSSSFSGSQIGGGFVSNNNEFGSGGQRQKRVIPYDERKLSQVTCKQIINAPPADQDDPVMIDEVEVSQLHMMARILSVDVQSSHTSYTINDYTGTLAVKQWHQDDQQQGPNIAEGTWVHIFGRINSFQGKCSINAFDVIPVTDFNEITHHFTEVIFAHLMNLETAKKQAMGMNNGSMMGMGNSSTNDMGPGYGNGVNSGNGGFGGNSGGFGGGNQGGFGGGNQGGFGGGNQGDDKPVLHQMILKVVKSPEFAHNETGCNVNNIFQRLPNENVQAIREAIDILAEEGIMYSTVDEEHYKAVE